MPNPPLGYQFFGHGFDLTVDEKEAEIVRYIFDMYLAVTNFGVVADLCSYHGYVGKRGAPFSSDQVRFILMNRTYTENPRIIDDETFLKAQEFISIRSCGAGIKRKKKLQYEFL